MRFAVFACNMKRGIALIVEMRDACWIRFEKNFKFDST